MWRKFGGARNGTPDAGFAAPNRPEIGRIAGYDRLV
jgi:hypothetical protein